MGIFRYFYWHFKTYPKSIIPVQQEQRVPGFDIFALDLNAIFHPVCQKYFFQTPGKKTFEGCYAEICKEIDRLTSHIPPKEELVLSIDGVAGLSKVNQQRQRRYRSVKEKDPELRELFDTNQISVGTEFMIGLRNYIKLYYKDRAVMLLDDQVGEGEHKIIRYLHQKQKKKICIYSPDADLIMLGIALDKKNVFIFRPNIYSDIDCSYFLVSIDKFKKDVSQMVDSTQEDRETQIVTDFVFLLFFLGNDFLPHSPSYEIKYGGINMILSMYQSVLKDSPGLVMLEKGVYSIRVPLLRKVLEELSIREIEMIKLKYKNFRGFPNKLLDQYIRDIDRNFSEYRKAYYQKYFGESLDEICREYLNGLCFVGTYYHYGMPDWWYQYRYDHAPFFTDLYEYVQECKEDSWYVEFNKNEPLSPLEQLMCVLPHESKNFLPRCIQSFYDEKSELEDLYPKQFEIDRDGVEQEYEALVMLPRIDPQRIRKAFQKVAHLLSHAEKERNVSR